MSRHSLQETSWVLVVPTGKTRHVRVQTRAMEIFRDMGIEDQVLAEATPHHRRGLVPRAKDR